MVLSLGHSTPGRSPDAIPDEAILSGTVRAGISPERRQHVEPMLRRCAQSVCTLAGTTYELDLYQGAQPNESIIRWWSTSSRTSRPRSWGAACRTSHCRRWAARTSRSTRSASLARCSGWARLLRPPCAQAAAPRRSTWTSAPSSWGDEPPGAGGLRMLEAKAQRPYMFDQRPRVNEESCPHDETAP